MSREINLEASPPALTMEPDKVRDPRYEALAHKIWAGATAVLSAAIVISIFTFPAVPAALAITTLVINALCLSILLLSEAARYLSKESTFLAGLDYELIFALTGAILTYFKDLTKENPVFAEGEKVEKEPILLVHGYLHNSSGWWLFKKRLKKAGIDNPLYTINLGAPWKHSLEDYTRKVQDKIEDIKRATGAKTVKIVGHSMGGVVGVNAATDSVSEVITIGSPLQGTKLARIGIGKCAKQMRQNSTFIRELQDKIAKTNCTHIGSEADLVILPRSSATPNKSKSHTFKHLGHLSLLYSEQVAHKVADLLNTSFKETPQ